MELLTWLDKGVGFVQIGLEWVRGTLEKVANWLPWESGITLTILFLLVSIWFGQFVAKKFTTRPFQSIYLIWTLVISALTFLVLAYL